MLTIVIHRRNSSPAQNPPNNPSAKTKNIHYQHCAYAGIDDPVGAIPWMLYCRITKVLLCASPGVAVLTVFALNVAVLWWLLAPGLTVAIQMLPYPVLCLL